MFKKDNIDKDGFMKAVKEILLGIVEKIGTNYRKDYADTLDTILLQVKSKFGDNLDTYSLNMKALIENKDAMMKLGEKIFDAAEALKRCESDLNDIIWREIQ